MTRDQALATLGITGEPPHDMRRINAAFSARCRESHPDTAACPDPDQPLMQGPAIATLQEARDILRNDVKKQNSACKLCRGMGKVRGTMGWQRCVACAGTGETK